MSFEILEFGIANFINDLNWNVSEVDRPKAKAIRQYKIGTRNQNDTALKFLAGRRDLTPEKFKVQVGRKVACVL